MTTNRVIADCRKYPSEKNCSLTISGTEEEVLSVALDHAVSAHGHARTPALREDLRKILAPDLAAGPAEANRELALQEMQNFNRRDFDAIERTALPDLTMINVATGEVFHGPKGLRAYAERWATAFPDSKVEVESVTGGPDGYVVEFIGSGTHSGPLVGPLGSLPPTGRRISLRFAEAAHVRDGKIADGRLYFDMATMMSQLGLGAELPAAAAQQPAEAKLAPESRRPH